jgi:hypothetical protein
LRSRVSPFRSGGGLLTPEVPTGRPGRIAVGVGPAGREPGGVVLAGAPSAAADLTRAELADFDGWMKSRVGREAAEAVGASIRAVRAFDEWDFSEWWSRSRNDADAIAKQNCMRFFKRPFNGALVERTARREPAETGDAGPWVEEPMVVRAYAEAGELTGFERPGEAPPTEVPVVSAVPRLAHVVEELLRQGTLLTAAPELLVQVWFVVTMRDVVLARGEAPRWNAVARRELDRRAPALFQRVTWMIDGAWSPF